MVSGIVSGLRVVFRLYFLHMRRFIQGSFKGVWLVPKIKRAEGAGRQDGCKWFFAVGISRRFLRTLRNCSHCIGSFVFFSGVPRPVSAG